MVLITPTTLPIFYITVEIKIADRVKRIIKESLAADAHQGPGSRPYMYAKQWEVQCNATQQTRN